MMNRLAVQAPEARARRFDSGKSVLAGLVLVIVSQASGAPAKAQTIYQTRDESGQIVFTDRPADDATIVKPSPINVADPAPSPSAVAPMAGSTAGAAGQGNLAGEAGTPPIGTTVTASQAASTPPGGSSTGQSTGPSANSSAGASTGLSSGPVTGTAAGSANGPTSAPTATSPSTRSTIGSAPDRVAPPIDPLDSRSSSASTTALPPGASTVELPALRPDATTTETDLRVFITSPAANERVITTESPVWVAVRVEPKPFLQSGLTAELWLNDRRIVTARRPLLPLPLPERGTHKLQIRLVDDAGEVISESDSQALHVMQGVTSQ